MAPQKLPHSQRAVRQGDDGHPILVNDAPIPSLPSGYVLVKTIAVALNPSDYKILTNFPLPGAYIGADFCGTVVELGDDVNPDDLQIGAVVCGAAFTFSPAHRMANGAFAEYVRARADLLLRVPPSPSPSSLSFPSAGQDRIGYLEAATLGTAVSTCVIALWSPEALGLSGTPDTPVLSEKPAVPVLVYGGSTSTGTIAIQLLRLSGYDPIATCSPRNFDLVRSRGASAVFDYSSPDTVDKIKAYTGGRLKYALDCISDADSVSSCYGAIQRPGGRYASLEHVPDEILSRRRAVRPTFVLSSEVYGEEVKLGRQWYDRPVSKAKHDLAVQCISMFQRLLDGGKLRPHPMEVLGNGLAGTIGGLEVLAGGGVSGKKLVVVVDGDEEGDGANV